MKLSEKGLKKFEVAIFETEEYGISSGYGYANGVTVFQLEGHEFEPDDFKGVVVLTVEEANKVKHMLDFVRFSDVDTEILFDVHSIMYKRIEQAENGNEVCNRS